MATPQTDIAVSGKPHKAAREAAWGLGPGPVATGVTLNHGIRTTNPPRPEWQIFCSLVPRQGQCILDPWEPSADAYFLGQISDLPSLPNSSCFFHLSE